MSNQKENQQENQQASAITVFRQSLEGKMREEVAKALPKDVEPDRFIRTVITTVQLQPELLEANRTSLFASCMQAAKDGLLPDGKEATIQIYSTNVGTKEQPNWQKMAQYMPMVRGLINKMYQAGATKVDAAAVYEKDHFVYLRGDEDRIEHHPDVTSDDAGPVIAAYAIIKLGNGETKREVMPRRDIEKVRAASKASNGPGWKNWYDQFAIKAVLKRIYKQMPNRSPELDRVFDADNEAMGFEFDNEKPAAISQQPRRSLAAAGSSSRLKNIMGSGIRITDDEPVDTKPEKKPEAEQHEQHADE